MGATAAADPAVPAATPGGARIIPFPGHGSAEAAPHVPAAPARDSIRWALVRSARARMAADFYDRPRVRERIADALLLELLSP